MLRILFVGPLRNGSTTLQRMTALLDLGHQVRGINTWKDQQKIDPLVLVDRFFAKIYRWGSPIKPTCHDRANANQTILKAFREKNWDVLWIDKGLTIDAETLIDARKIFPGVKIVGYSPDDMLAKHNHSRQFLEHLPGYDIFFTTKSFNVDELKSLGCPNVVFVDNAFDPQTHRPMNLSLAEIKLLGGQIGFIGSYEIQRAKSICFLEKNGFPTRVYGGNWTGQRILKNSRLKIEGKTVLAEDFAKAICSFDINLHFLRKINRDQQTTRSIEIPACGKFMLAERTDEHQSLFEEGHEAAFFGSDEELLDKVIYYLENPDERIKIGLSGRERCLRSGYSNHERLKKMLQIVERL